MRKMTTVLIMVLIGFPPMVASAELASQSQQESTVVAFLTEDQLAVLNRLEPDLQRFVDQLDRLPGQEHHIPLEISGDPSSGIIWIELGSGFIPSDQREFSEDIGVKIGEISEELRSYIEGKIRYFAISARIGGKTLDEIFPPFHLRGTEALRGADLESRAVGEVPPS